MATLDIIVKPKLKFSLKKCGDVVPYGITPEEKAKLAGIEENANNYTHPETHPSSILDVVDVVNGAANKFLNERGEMVAVATSSIGVTGSQLYASTANSDVAGYKSLVGTPQASETEITLTAKSTVGIVWGDKYLSAPFTEAVTIPATAYGFDYWRKVSAANGTSRKHLRVFLYRAGVETNISTPLASPDIDETEFTERQISYIFPELVLLAGDRIGIQEGFSTTHANNITLTYIVGDGRGWFMRLPLPLKHESLTDKNSEAAFQHVDTTTTKQSLDAADMVAIKDSVTGKVVLTAINAISVFFSSLFLKFGGQIFGAKKTIGSTDNQDFAIKTNDIERVTILKDGKVGVGRTDPQRNLTVSRDFRITDGVRYVEIIEDGSLSYKLYSSGYFILDAGGVAAFQFNKNSGTGGSIFYDGNNVEIAKFNSNGNINFAYNKGSVGVGNTAPKSKLHVSGAIQIADDTASASADKEGAIRYRKNANNSYVEMCMQTGATTYAWVIIKQNTW